MTPLPNEIILRPRFQLKVSAPKEDVLKALEKSEKKPFLVKRLDEHIFIKFNQNDHHFWSPQLHLEIETENVDSSKVYGVFGPNPTLWTFFMFLHFGVALLFIILSVWAYSSAALNKPYAIQLGLMIFLVIVWFILYFLGRAGKRKGKPQMQDLYRFMEEALNN